MANDGRKAIGAHKGNQLLVAVNPCFMLLLLLLLHASWLQAFGCSTLPRVPCELCVPPHSVVAWCWRCMHGSATCCCLQAQLAHAAALYVLLFAPCWLVAQVDEHAVMLQALLLEGQPHTLTVGAPGIGLHGVK